MSKRLLTSAASAAIFTLLLASFYCPAAAQPERIPVQADLLQPMEAGRIKVGSPVFAKVEAE